MPNDQRKRLTAPRAVTLSQRDIGAVLEAMPERKAGATRIQFTPEQDAALLKYQPVRTWKQLMEAFGLSENTLRRRFGELTAGRK